MTCVLQVTPALDAGGVERTTIDIAAAVTARGWRALVASAGGRLESELAAAGGELIRLPLDTKNPLRVLANASALGRIIEREAVDIVHARSRAPAWSALWAARGQGVAFVTTYHGTYNARSGLKRWYNSVMARGDRVIANSGFIAEHIGAEHAALKSRLESRIVTIPRGVDVEALDPAAVSVERLAALREAWRLPAGDRRAIIALPGRLTRWKGQAVAIEALAELKAQGLEALLVMPGDDQGRVGYRDELEALAAARGVAEAVRLPGHAIDMPAAYALCDIVVSASVEPEAFGRVAVEAQAMGRPVVATDHGGARETIEPGVTGLLAAPGDAPAMAAALAELLRAGPAARLAMGEKGAARARRLYSVEAMQASTMSVYDAVLEERR